MSGCLWHRNESKVDLPCRDLEMDSQFEKLFDSVRFFHHWLTLVIQCIQHHQAVSIQIKDMLLHWVTNQIPALEVGRGPNLCISTHRNVSSNGERDETETMRTEGHKKTETIWALLDQCHGQIYSVCGWGLLCWVSFAAPSNRPLISKGPETIYSRVALSAWPAQVLCWSF